MHQRPESNKSILITGGTSGLGLELVKCFLDKGYEVIATGRKQTDISGFTGKYFFYRVDFGDLRQVADTTSNISRNHSLEIIINNAGILSPPSYTETSDGLEYTFQINFLAHLLIGEIVLRSIKEVRPLLIASVTSPVYRLAGNNPGISHGAGDYRPMHSYSSSKLFLTMLHEFFAAETNKSNIHCFSFDPGTFSSAIYRMQKNWFIKMYHIAAPFMKSPRRVANVLCDILLNEDPEDGMIYDISKREKAVPSIDKSQKDALIRRCHELIDPFLKQAASLKF